MLLTHRSSALPQSPLWGLLTTEGLRDAPWGDCATIISTFSLFTQPIFSQKAGNPKQNLWDWLDLVFTL